VEEEQQAAWSFDLFAYGPFAIQGRYSLDCPEPTTQDAPFFQSFDLKNSPHGAHISLKVAADTGYFAQQAATVYLDRLLDVMSFYTNVYMQLSRAEPRPFARGSNVTKRMIEQAEWQQAFREAKQLDEHAPFFLRALHWYRKALGAENPTERYASFWRALCQLVPITDLEQIQGLCAPRLTSHCEGLWGAQSSWPHMQHETKPFSQLEEVYQDITIGPTPMRPSFLKDLLELLDPLHRMTHAMLVEWRNQRVDLPGEYHHTSLHLETGWGDVLQ